MYSVVVEGGGEEADEKGRGTEGVSVGEGCEARELNVPIEVGDEEAEEAMPREGTHEEVEDEEDPSDEGGGELESGKDEAHAVGWMQSTPEMDDTEEEAKRVESDAHIRDKGQGGDATAQEHHEIDVVGESPCEELIFEGGGVLDEEDHIKQEADRYPMDEEGSD